MKIQSYYALIRGLRASSSIFDINAQYFIFFNTDVKPSNTTILTTPY